MQRIHQISALCFIALSGFVVLASMKMEYYSALGPGPGFFPFWLGLVLGGVSLIWLIQVSRPSGRPKDGAFLPEKEGVLQIVSILLALSANAFFMGIIGFQLTMFLFMVFLLRVLGRRSLWMTLIIAVVCSVGVYHVFGGYLDVQLPVASLEIFAALGL
jgi:putative tricarboxylic transport membrane protein